MSENPDPDLSDALHIELRSAINDLAKSVQVAVLRINLRAECDATIADAEKTELAAKNFRAAMATEAAEQAEVPLVPEAIHRLEPDSGRPVGVSGLEAMDTICIACTWLAENQASHPQSKPEPHEDSAIAMRIVELQDRLREQGK
jgi:hypothetical protein